VDLLFGGAGADREFGRSGNDLLFGNADNDCLDGGGDSDFLFGNDGDDMVDGNAGSDFLFGGKGADTMNGDSEDDYMFGGRDADKMYGGPGRDIMFGNGGPDTMFGGDGWDWCFGGPGPDTIDGDGANHSLDPLCVACNVATSVLKGMVFLDRNCDGIRDTNEPGLTNWVIKYTGPVSGTLITGSGGLYTITDLPEGTYTLCEVQHAGWTQSLPSGCYTIKLGTGETRTDLDFGNCASNVSGTDDVLPTRFELRGVRPNPVSGSARFTISLPQSAVVTLKIYDMAGRVVATLAEGETFPAGTLELELDAHGLRSGMYLSRVVIQAADGTGAVYRDAKRMVLVR
jgi:hypothetical protein